MPKIGARGVATVRPRTDIPKALTEPPMILPRACAEDVSVLAIDPGGARAKDQSHCGVVIGSRYLYDATALDEFSRDEVRAAGMEAGPRWEVQAPGWRVYDYAIMSDADFCEWVYPRLGSFDIVTCEKFTLYPNLAKEQTGSEMRTSQVIGFMRHLVRIWNHTDRRARGGEHDIDWYSYPAAIQEPTLNVLRHQGIALETPASPDHARSAELHFWHTLIRNGMVEGVELA
jgi:hypothetical protein